MDWVQLVSNYGFPIVVSLYLLIKTQQKLEEVSTLLTRITENLNNVREEKRERRTSTKQVN